MCGLVGAIYKGSVGPGKSAHVIKLMTDAIIHRGPDSHGSWVDEDSSVLLGHRRLSIRDLSSAGDQPMKSFCGRYVLVFNGEIYDHLSIRDRLRSHSCGSLIAWRGASDTETLLAGFSAWGVESTLKRCTGMFALALWDLKMRTLTLARDRFGEKPLYFGFARGASNSGAMIGSGPFLFSSELKAMMAHPEWQGVLAEDTLEDYLRFGSVGGTTCIFKGVAKLPPGSMLTLSQADVQAGHLPAPVQWWSVDQAAREARCTERLVDSETALGIVEESLKNSVRQRMLADVPLGALLSGGVDSSLVVALMQYSADKPVRTFSVGFDDVRYDESAHSQAVATYLGTEHTTLQATPCMTLALVPKLSDIYDEPFADSSQLPMALISQLTREHVVVALSGDGGDELFGGYNRHLWVPRIWRQLERLPLTARRILARTLKSIPANAYDHLLKSSAPLVPPRFRLRTFGEKVHKLAAVLDSTSEQELFAGVASMNCNPGALLVPGCERRKTTEALFPTLQGFNSVEWMLLMDTLHYMVDDVLVKVDRASMASSLEIRAPFLDPEVFQAAWRIPSDIKLRDGQGKWLLRQILYKHVPHELIDRPKMGFAVPLDAWLRGPLRDWAEDLLSLTSLTALPMLDAIHVRRLWSAHLKGRGHYAQHLWAVLQLIAWQRRWRPHLA